jgi:enterochelin esterase family protein
LLAVCFAHGQTLKTLKVGEAIDGKLETGTPQNFTLTLKSGDYVRVSSTPGLHLSLYLPSGEKYKTFQPAGGGKRATVAFVAEPAGSYRIEVSGAEGNAASFQLTVEAIESLDDRMTLLPSSGPLQSSRLKTLQAEIERGHQQALDLFWHDVAQQGTPLIDRIADDPKHVFATFLWRATYETRGVLLAWLPFCTVWPDRYRFAHMTGTDVWYLTLKLPSDARFRYSLSQNDPPGFDAASMDVRFLGIQSDPLNPKHFLSRGNDVSIAEMPDAPASHWLVEHASVQKGSLEKKQLKNTILGYEPTMTIYTPAGYPANGKSYDALIVLDGDAYLHEIPTPIILDNLISEQRIRPVVALFLNSSGSRKELNCDSQFSDFLAKELSAWLRTQYRVTSDPGRIVLVGASSGGLAAACAALMHPESFGNVLSQSGAFQWTESAGFQGNVDDPEPDEIVQRFLKQQRLPLKFYLEAGTDELNFVGRNPPVSGRHLRDVLIAKGYEVHWRQFNGGHDYIDWRQTLGDALITLLSAQEH